MTVPDVAELSSLDTALDDMVDRVAAITQRRLADDPDDQLANELFEVERLLTGASRRMTRILHS